MSEIVLCKMSISEIEKLFWKQKRVGLKPKLPPTNKFLAQTIVSEWIRKATLKR